MKRIRKLVEERWQSWLLTVAIVGLVVGLSWYRLASITPGLSRPEISALQGTGSLRAIALNPSFLPFKLAHYILIKLGLHGTLAVRSVSAAFGLITILLFYYILRLWYTQRISILATLLLTSSAWFLHIARIATPEILFPLCAALLVVYGARMHIASNTKFGVIVGFLLVASVVYVPGLFWVVICLALWQRKLIAEQVQPLALWQQILAALLGLMLLTPLAYATIHNARILLDVLAVPSQIDAHGWLIHAYQVPKLLFIRGPDDPTIWVGTMPLLDIMMTGMFVLGLYGYYLRKNLVRTSVIVLFFSVTILLLTISTTVSVGLLLPAVFLIITAGITFYLQQWLAVFPRNPIARWIGYFVLFAAISVSVWFQLKCYFVAWPKAPTTKAAYRLQI